MLDGRRIEPPAEGEIEQGGLFEHDHVTRIGDEDELGGGDVLREVFGIFGWGHLVLSAADDQGGSLNLQESFTDVKNVTGGKIAGNHAAAGLQEPGRAFLTQARGCVRRVIIFDQRVGSGLKIGFHAVQKRGRHAESRSCPDKDQTANAPGRVKREGLGDGTAHRGADENHTLKLQCVQKLEHRVSKRGYSRPGG